MVKVIFLGTFIYVGYMLALRLVFFTGQFSTIFDSHGRGVSEEEAIFKFFNGAPAWMGTP